MADMRGGGYIKPFIDFEQVWGGLESCGNRGIHYYNENDRNMEYASFSDIYRKAGILAGILKKKGIKRGDRVLVCARTSLFLPSLWLGHIWIGAAVVPMPIREAMFGKECFRTRISHILANFQFYICEENEKADIMEVSKQISKEIHFITYEELFHELNTGDIEIPPRMTPKNEDLAFIQYTSGSTSRPKGIMLRYENLFTNLYDIWTRVELNPETAKIASWLPLYHDMGLVAYLLGSIFLQVELVLESPLQFAKRPLQFLEFISSYKIDACSMPNFAMEWILRRYDPDQNYSFDLSHLKWLGIGAEPVNLRILEEFEHQFSRYGLQKGVVSPCYGMAEANLAISIEKPLRRYEKVKIGKFEYPTNGPILDDMKVKIDKDQPGDPYGVIKIKGGNVAKHALIDRKIVSLLDHDGFYNTKDIGLIHNGKLVILGRSDDMFIVNGENFFPYDIESAVRSMKFISRNRVVCFDIPASESESGHVELIVLYEIRRLSESDTKAIETEIDHVIFQKTGLKAAKIIGVPPKTIEVTPSGKIRRNLMRTKYLEGKTLITEQIGNDIISL